MRDQNEGPTLPEDLYVAAHVRYLAPFVYWLFAEYVLPGEIHPDPSILQHSDHRRMAEGHYAGCIVYRLLKTFFSFNTGLTHDRVATCPKGRPSS